MTVRRSSKLVNHLVEDYRRAGQVPVARGSSPAGQVPMLRAVEAGLLPDNLAKLLVARRTPPYLCDLWE
jgi:hypothetical protein